MYARFLKVATFDGGANSDPLRVATLNTRRKARTGGSEGSNALEEAKEAIESVFEVDPIRTTLGLNSVQTPPWEHESLTPATMDCSARASMKDAAKCETRCELQDLASHSFSQRTCAPLGLTPNTGARRFSCLGY